MLPICLYAAVEIMFNLKVDNVVLDILLFGFETYFVLSICLYATAEIIFDLKVDSEVFVISEENL